MNLKISGKKVVVFGGTGFIGSHLVNGLCKEACQVDIVTRSNKKKLDFFIGNEPGQIRIVKINSFTKDNIDLVINGADIVFNLIGILYETRQNSFKNIHEEIPRKLASSASRMGVRNFVHISALNIEKSKDSAYANSKLLGENTVKENFPNSVIVRPGVVFGKGDNFTNFFYSLSKISPILPLIGTPEIKRNNSFFPMINFRKKVRFQPIYVVDLVNVLINICILKKKVLELAGPTIQTFDEIFDIILRRKGKKRFYLPIPFFVARILAFFLEILPHPVLTRDQIKLLKIDNISPRGFSNLKNFVKNPSSLHTIIGGYL
ncbi:MAG: complex I NDUFA9 subunit family protein [Pseudomonadota bacterium]|nr:complex I NDUFA9 subunit family protein [Pseudomonadota bacterium]